MHFIWKYVQSMPIRTKLICSMLFVSFASILMVGWIANQQMMAKFDEAFLEDASQRFSHEVAAYIARYGSWQQGMQQEPFRRFSARHAPMMPPPGAPDWPNAPHGPDPQGQHSQPDPIGFPMPAFAAPPFRFYLFDPQYHALIALPPYAVGSRVNPLHQTSLKPIYLEDKIVAYFTPQGRPNYSELDIGYMAAMQRGLLLGGVAACLLTLVLGVLIGNQLSRGLRKLTRAVQALDEQNMQQYVEVNSRDEVGKLAQAFNHMSARMHEANQALLDSHQAIQQKAIQLREWSFRDSLTQLYNRRHFDAHSQQLYQQALRYQHPFSLLLADIDHFKQINDRYSHQVGDQVLIEVASLLGQQVRSSDLVARYGGEEFIIAFPETDINQAKIRSENLRQTIEQYHWSSIAPDLKVTISMGLSSGLRVNGLESLIIQADKMLYTSKRQGRNRLSMQAL